MSNTYRSVSPWAKARYGEDVVDLDLSAAEEKDMLDGRHLELVPRKYKVTSHRFSGYDVGDEVEVGVLVEQEQMLINGGHLERVEPKTPAKKTAKKAADKND